MIVAEEPKLASKALTVSVDLARVVEVETPQKRTVAEQIESISVLPNEPLFESLTVGRENRIVGLHRRHFIIYLYRAIPVNAYNLTQDNCISSIHASFLTIHVFIYIYMRYFGTYIAT